MSVIRWIPDPDINGESVTVRHKGHVISAGVSTPHKYPSGMGQSWHVTMDGDEISGGLDVHGHAKTLAEITIRELLK
jgi:hypothetical protein